MERTLNFIKALNDIKSVIESSIPDQIKKDVTAASLEITVRAQNLLLSHGFESQLAGGYAIISVNSDKEGSVTIGSPNEKTKKPGHFWLVTEFGVVDYVLPFLKAYFLSSNKNQNYLLKDSPLVAKTQTKSAIALGKVGCYYLKLDSQCDIINAARV